MNQSPIKYNRPLHSTRLLHLSSELQTRIPSPSCYYRPQNATENALVTLGAPYTRWLEPDLRDIVSVLHSLFYLFTAYVSLGMYVNPYQKSGRKYLHSRVLVNAEHGTL